MIGPVVVAAHGFREAGPATPTHVTIDAFRRWSEACRQHVGGFGDPADLPHQRAQAAAAGCEHQAPVARPILTFDDALASVGLVAESLAAPAILFVVAAHAGKRNDWPGQPAWVPREPCLSWAAIRDLAELGWTIGAHTMTHPRLSALPADRQRHEIEASSKSIEDRIGRPCRYFAYPYGDAPRTARLVVAESGMTGFGTLPGRVRPESDPACLPRVDLYDLVRPGVASQWAWSGPTRSAVMKLRCRRSIARFVPRRSVAHATGS
ncbi:polysaccharide deacetylase family protein [bacterium]|nr:polysaccharide deacetylase family protein [bacterium]